MSSATQTLTRPQRRRGRDCFTTPVRTQQQQGGRFWCLPFAEKKQTRRCVSYAGMVGLCWGRRGWFWFRAMLRRMQQSARTEPSLREVRVSTRRIQQRLRFQLPPHGPQVQPGADYRQTSVREGQSIHRLRNRRGRATRGRRKTQGGQVGRTTLPTSLLCMQGKAPPLNNQRRRKQSAFQGSLD